MTQRDTPTSHVTDLGLGTGIACTIRRLDAHLAVKRVEHADQGMVLGHGFRDLVPVRGVQRCGLGPADRICVSGGILEFPHRTGLAGVDGRKGTDVGVVRVGVVDGKVSRVDFVRAVSAVQVGQRGDAGPDPADVQGVCGVLDSSVVGVVDHELVFMGVAEKNTRNHMRREAVDDLVEEV